MIWKTSELSEISRIGDGAHASLKRIESGIPYLTAKNITKEGVDYVNIDYISEETYNKHFKEKSNAITQPKKDDILYSIIGSIGGVYVVQDEKIGISSSVAIFRTDSDIVIPQYLAYFLKGTSFDAQVQAIKGGVAQGFMSLGKLGSVTISYPQDIEYQAKIVSILSTYDNLIENNQKQIKLLEEAAQRLYKEWFVDLKFPNYEQTNVVDGIPEGWKKVTLGNICKLRKEVLKPEKIEKGIPYIGLEHIPRNDICLSEWGDSKEVNSNKYQCYENDILFGKIRPYFHKVGFSLVNCITSTDAIVMQAYEGMWGLLLMTVSSLLFVEYSYQTCKEGAKMPRADWDEMEKYSVLVASEDIQVKFEEIIWTITRRIKNIALQNRRLIEARNRLLPKLMNGEIEV